MRATALSTLSSVTRATPDDLAYVIHLQKQYGGALGFIPRAALEQKIERGGIWLAHENGQRAGYLHHGSLAVREVRIFQAAIQYDAQRQHLGWALVQSLLSHAAQAGALGVSLRCLSFLGANEFWSSLGFVLRTTEPGAKGMLNVWTRTLTRPDPCAGRSIRAHAASIDFEFHSRLHPCPACGLLTTDTWTRGAIRHRACRACVAVG